MLITSVILVLREVLEAAVLITVLLALATHLRIGWTWLAVAIPLAVAGMVLYAGNLARITDALDGAGQEISNASMQLLVYALILLTIALSATGKACGTGRARVLAIAMALTVALAMVREGAEIWVYISGFSTGDAYPAAVYAGSVIGAGIGMSVGVLLFALLRVQTPTRRHTLCLALLCLTGAGMVMQATMPLQQVDYLPAGSALWDTSWLISERSIPGELLYAVFGYEATPSLLQVSLYTGCLLILALVAGYGLRRREHPL